MGSDRPTLTVDPAQVGARCPVHPSHRLALVGESPGHLPSAGMFRELIGLSRTQYLRTFARATLLDAHPGPVFPVSIARALAEPLCQRLAPRPLFLLGRGVSMAFQFPRQYNILDWVSYRLGNTWCCAAVLPHPSERNSWYNDPANRARARAFVLQTLTDGGIDLGT